MPRCSKRTAPEAVVVNAASSSTTNEYRNNEPATKRRRSVNDEASSSELSFFSLKTRSQIKRDYLDDTEYADFHGEVKETSFIDSDHYTGTVISVHENVDINLNSFIGVADNAMLSSPDVFDVKTFPHEVICLSYS